MAALDRMQQAGINTIGDPAVGFETYVSLGEQWDGHIVRLRASMMYEADEIVACGFGRTGRLFACEHFDLDPDLLCVAKAMSSGLAPIGAVIATAPIATSMEENGGTFYSTYGWHPRSVAAAIATLRALKANRRRLLAGVEEMSEYFRVRLLQLEFDRPPAVRIQGLAIEIDVGDEDYADAVHGRCRRNGLLVSTEGSTVLLLPSLAIDKRTATRGLDILARSI